MSELTDTLELLDDWLYRNEPEVFERLPLGLDENQIDELAKNLNFD